ncbi:MAG: hypothetical protein M5T61_05245 [Acidimicrobiia bacterium]|nr:hypothetical protein [Acidimicrobiia bacterium]
MLLTLWSPKGGSGTSVAAASCALVLAASGRARLADLDGDLPAVLGLATDPAPGLTDWLLAGADAPSDALARLSVEAGPGLSLLPAGAGDPRGAAPEAGAALAVLLRDDPAPTVADLGRAEAPALEAMVEVADASVVVVRGCYMALRRAVHRALTARATGAVLVEEPGRSLGEREVADVLGVPVLATFPLRPAVARTVDAGVLVVRPPDCLVRSARRLLGRLGMLGSEGAAA